MKWDKSQIVDYGHSIRCERPGKNPYEYTENSIPCGNSGAVMIGKAMSTESKYSNQYCCTYQEKKKDNLCKIPDQLLWVNGCDENKDSCK